MAARFDWSTYLALAEELGAREDEASLRSAISRAYYFVYHLALQRAEANDLKASPGEPSHRQLWRLFDESPETACRKLGVIATRLKQKRERADYEPVFVRLWAVIVERWWFTWPAKRSSLYEWADFADERPKERL
ncbi:MAG: hypothetical protein SFV51_25170 [Bryobacteraceae bacterium]|nr:hypothetical protein [Bryobacteraceae bacterium]